MTPPKRDPAHEPRYTAAAAELRRLHTDAAALYRQGRREAAGKRILEAQPFSAELLAVPRPTLEAMMAVSDLDDLYARILFENRQYGWARLLFQKNAARWRTWAPRSEETEQLRRSAEAGIAACDRKISQ